MGLTDVGEADPAKLIPLEAARATLMHWWREPIAGLCSIAIGAFDAWHFGRDSGLSANVDELLIIGGIVLVAGSRTLFLGSRGSNSVGPQAVDTIDITREGEK